MKYWLRCLYIQEDFFDFGHWIRFFLNAKRLLRGFALHILCMSYNTTSSHIRFYKLLFSNLLTWPRRASSIQTIELLTMPFNRINLNLFFFVNVEFEFVASVLRNVSLILMDCRINRGLMFHHIYLACVLGTFCLNPRRR